jgi:sulfate/thiosulfate transport system permease protein
MKLAARAPLHLPFVRRNDQAAPVPRARRSLAQSVLIGVVLLYVGILIGTPLAALVRSAFSAGLEGMLRALIQPEVLSAFWLTIAIGLGVVAVHAVSGTLAAWVMVRHSFPGKALLNGLIDLPFAVSPVVVGYVLLLLFGRSGWLAPVVQAMGIRVAFALPGMFLATLFVTLPFMIRELIPVLEAFEIQQEQAAATLGASGWQIFWRVTLPALRWGVIYGLSLTFARALGEFGAVLVIGGAVQGQTETATLFIYRALEERQYAGAYSAALVLGLISFALVMGVDFVRRLRE